MSKKTKEVKDLAVAELKAVDEIVVDLGKVQVEKLQQIDGEVKNLQNAYIVLKERQELIVISTIEALKIDGVKGYKVDLENGKLTLTK